MIPARERAALDACTSDVIRLTPSVYQPSAPRVVAARGGEMGSVAC